MPTNQSVILQKGTVPPDACFNNVSELYDLFIGTTTAYVNGNYSLFNYGENKPSTDDTDKPWIRTVGNLPDRVYVYASGYWLSKHQTPAGGDERRIWVGSLVDLKTYDGGADEDVNDFTGPFWEVDEELAAKFPVGVGEFPSGADVAINGIGGSETVTLTSDQLPNHEHLGEAYYRAVAGPASTSDPSGLADATLHENSGHTNNASYNSFNKAGVITTSMTGASGQAHTNLPPYYGVYFIKRTGRIYYAIK